MDDPMQLRVFDAFFGTRATVQNVGDGEWGYEAVDAHGIRLALLVQETAKQFDVALYRESDQLVEMRGDGVVSIEVRSDARGSYMYILCDVDLVKSEAEIRLVPHVKLTWRACV